MQLKSYKDLTVWQRSMQLVEEVYKTSSRLPREELFGLVSQMRRSAVSIPSNIAEGYGRKGTGEYIHFLKVANASSTELETQLIIAKNVHGVVTEVCEGLIVEVQKMLIVLINKLNTKV